MSTISRAVRFIGKILAGKDVLLVPQDAQRWDMQFARGRWDWLAANQPNTQKIAECILELSRKRRKVRVVDVGCGNGGLIRMLAGRAESIEYLGIDISAAAVKRIGVEFPEAAFRVCDASVPPPDIGVFDVFVFNEVLYYMDPAVTLLRYVPHAAHNAVVMISIVRTWRTPFLWRRIRSHIRVHTKLRIQKAEGHRAWDIGIGGFKRLSS